LCLSLFLQACTKAGGSCLTILDGYYIESILCVVIGFMWYIWRHKHVRQLDNLPLDAWKCS
jgi:PAT family acetyl-CoA transporter-like MFS transporter 1